MNAISTSLADLFDRVPRRHSLDNVKEINGLVEEYEDILVKVEAVNPYYENNISSFFDALDVIRDNIKKSTDNKASKKLKDSFFDEASSLLKDGIEQLIVLYADGNKTK